MHKSISNNIILSIKKCAETLDSSLKTKKNTDLIKLINLNKFQSDNAKTLIIYRFLPKVFRESKKIFREEIFNSWNKEEIIQTGIKAILYAIQDFSNKEKNQQTEALFTYITCFYIEKYLNKKKINYDPLIHFNKGPEFKKVFYSYFKIIKKLSGNNNSKKICEHKICYELGTDIKTLREVQYAHNQLLIIKSQDESLNESRNCDFTNNEKLNYLDYALVNGMISEIDEEKKDPLSLVINNEKRNICHFKNILSPTEYKFLDLLNSGKTKEDIYKKLKISKQRFSFLKNNITKKIKKFRTGIYL